MAFSATLDTRAYSIGPVKQIRGSFTAVSGDTSGTITVPQLTSIDSVMIGGGLRLTAAPTISGNTITIAFVDPSTGGYFGELEVHGK